MSTSDWPRKYTCFPQYGQFVPGSPSCDVECLQFVSLVDGRCAASSPSSADALCAFCGHAWWEHSPVPVSRVPEVNVPAARPPSNVVSQPRRTQPAVTRTAAPVPAGARPLAPYASPPVAVFTGVPQPAAAIPAPMGGPTALPQRPAVINAARRASALRTLPHNQHSNNRLVLDMLNAGRDDGSLADSIGTQPLPTSALTMTSGSRAAPGTFGSGTGTQEVHLPSYASGTLHSGPSGDSSRAPLKLLLGILSFPVNCPTTYPTHGLNRWPGLSRNVEPAAWERLLNDLAERDRLIMVEFLPTDDPHLTLVRQLTARLRQLNLDWGIPLSDEQKYWDGVYEIYRGSGRQYKGNTRQNLILAKASPQEPATAQWLADQVKHKSMVSSFSAGPYAGLPFLFIVPRTAPLTGPINSFLPSSSEDHLLQRHLCYGYWDILRFKDLLQSPLPPAYEASTCTPTRFCLPGCPGSTPVAGPSRRRAAPDPTLSPPPFTRPRLGSVGYRDYTSRSDVLIIPEFASAGSAQLATGSQIRPAAYPRAAPAPLAAAAAPPAWAASMSAAGAAPHPSVVPPTPAASKEAPNSAPATTAAINADDSRPQEINRAAQRAKAAQDFSNPYLFDRWATRFQKAVLKDSIVTYDDTISLQAETLDTAGRALIKLLRHYNSKDYEYPSLPEWDDPGIQHMPSPHIALLSPMRRFSVGGPSPRRVASGAGIVRATFHHAVQAMAGDAGFCTPHHGWISPIFLPVDLVFPDRIEAWKAFGMLCALHFAYFCAAPDPISPFFILALLGEEYFDTLELRHIKALDPAAADKLEGWFSFPHSEPMPAGFGPVTTSILEADLQARRLLHADQSFLDPHVPQIPVIRAGMAVAEKRATVNRLMCCKVLLGIDSPWQNEEFLAAREGFNLELLEMNRSLSDIFVEPIVDEVVDPLFVLISTYNLRIGKPQDLIDRLRYKDGSLWPVWDERADLNRTLFRLYLERYLANPGHVFDEVMLASGLVSAEEAAQEKDNPVLRAELFLQAATGVLYLPFDPEETIDIVFTALPSIRQTLEDTDPSRCLDPPAEAGMNPMFFQTCALSISVKLNAAMEMELVRLPEIPSDPASVTTLDRWFHSQCMGKHLEYNRA